MIPVSKQLTQKTEGCGGLDLSYEPETKQLRRTVRHFQNNDADECSCLNCPVLLAVEEERGNIRYAGSGLEWYNSQPVAPRIVSGFTRCKVLGLNASDNRSYFCFG